MNVLITGGAGYIGSQTAKFLARSGVTPVVLDDLSTGHREAVRWGPFAQGSLGDRDFIRRVLRTYRFDGVIHFAGNAYVDESVVNPRKYFRNNVSNTLNLFDAMQEAGVQNVVFSSSCAVYGVPEQLPISECHPLKPISPYGDSKLFVERILQWYEGAYGLRWIALRYFNAAGADEEGEAGEDHDPETHLIPLAIHAALGRVPQVVIMGTDYPTPDGTAIRDYVHVCDLADAHIRALYYLLDGGESLALNLGTGRGHSVREVIRTVEKVLGRPVPHINAARRAGDPSSLVADPSGAFEVLHWKPRFSQLNEIVETAWRYSSCGHAVAHSASF
jgi:UDP-arabinose 4-epimerase